MSGWANDQPRPQGPPREKLPTTRSSHSSGNAEGPGDEVGKRSPNSNGGCKTEDATYKTISEEVKGNEGRKDEIILIDVKR